MKERISVGAVFILFAIGGAIAAFMYAGVMIERTYHTCPPCTVTNEAGTQGIVFTDESGAQFERINKSRISTPCLDKCVNHGGVIAYRGHDEPLPVCVCFDHYFGGSDCHLPEEPTP